MSEKMTAQELLAKAKKPAQLALSYHRFYLGKTQVMPKCAIRTYKDFSIWYTPGVAAPCRKIKEEPELVFRYTNKWNNVAVVSDGTRVLGLGDIGPEAGLPVMEGKALLFKYLGGVDAFPICLGTKNPEEIITAVKWLTPTFGGVNLEDISSPKCFYILERLRKKLEIPVWHDDQQGTALVTLAGLINALRIVGKKIKEVSIAMIGAGAANISVVKYITIAGAKLDNIIMVDSGGILHLGRVDVKDVNPVKWKMCLKTNPQGRVGGIAEALKDADVCIAYSRPGPGVIRKDWVADMVDDAVVFSGANPIPEIWPWDAEEAGAKIVATGRSDFPNQINNSLGFPAIFRGALDVGAKAITDEMCIAAAYAIADYAEKKGINEKYIIPTMDETEMYVEEAVAVGLKAIEQGVARVKLSRKELRQKVTAIIKNSRESTWVLMKEGLIKTPPPEGKF